MDWVCGSSYTHWAALALNLHVGFRLKTGAAQPALAFDITSWIITGTQLVYVMVWCKNEWTGLSWLAFKDTWAFVRLSLASAIMLCLEVWYMMSLIVLADHLDNVVIAVDSLTIWCLGQICT